MPGFLCITNSRSLLKLMSIESVIPSNHIILCHPLLLLPSIFPSIRVFSNDPVLHIRWPKYWSFSFSISPSSEYSGLILFDSKTWPKLPWGHLESLFIPVNVNSPIFYYRNANIPDSGVPFQNLLEVSWGMTFIFWTPKRIWSQGLGIRDCDLHKTRDSKCL